MTSNNPRIVEMAIQRIPPREIASQLNLHVDDVYSRIRAARREGHDIPHFNAKTPVAKTEAAASGLPQIVIPNRLHALLVREADRRGKSPAETAQRLLEDALLGSIGK